MGRKLERKCTKKIVNEKILAHISRLDKTLIQLTWIQCRQYKFVLKQTAA
jgi:hypothetical protein